MKYARIVAVAMVAALLLAAFAGCARRGAGNTTSLPAAVSSAVESGPQAGAGSQHAVESSGNAVESSDHAGDLSRSESQPHVSNVEPDSSHVPESIAAAMSADFSEIGALSGEKDTGFPGGPVDSQNRPSGPLAYQQKYGKYGAYFIIPDSKKIYLTFDEGYENGYTTKILDILKEKNVKAVFFITYPYAQTETALVKRMVAEGHTLGNHSTKHLIYPDMPLEEAAKDLMNLHEYVLAQYGYKMWLFRPPEGAFSEQTLALAQSLGYNTMLWSFAYKDYDVNNQPLAIEAEANILKKAHPGEIMLLHAVSRTNSEILGSVIDTLRERGFTFADYFYFQ